MTNDISERRRVCLAVLAIDGVVAAPGTTKVSEAVRRAVAGARTAGHHVVLASGRPLVGVLQVARELGLDAGWVLASHGAVTARLDPGAAEGVALHDARLFDPAPVARRVRSAFPGARVAAELPGGQGHRVTHLFAAHELDGAQQVEPLAKVIERRTTKLVLTAPGIVGMVGKLYATETTVRTHGTSRLEVTAPGLSTAAVLEDVRTKLDVPAGNTLAVGSGIHDLEMLAWARRRVAMGDAMDAVRHRSKELTGTFEQDGVVEVLSSLPLEATTAGR